MVTDLLTFVEVHEGTIEVVDEDVVGDGTGTGRTAFYDLHMLTVDSGATVFSMAKMLLGVNNCPDQSCLTFTLRGKLLGVHELHIYREA